MLNIEAQESKPRPTIKVTQAQIDSMSFAKAKASILQILEDLSREYEASAMKKLSRPLAFSPLKNLDDLGLPRYIESVQNKNQLNLKNITFKLLQDLDQIFSQYEQQIQDQDRKTEIEHEFLISKSDAFKLLREQKIQNLYARLDSLEMKLNQITTALSAELQNFEDNSIHPQKTPFFGIERLKKIEFIVVIFLQMMTILYFVLKSYFLQR